MKQKFEHTDTGYSIGNIVNNVIVTRYGARSVFETAGGGGLLSNVHDFLTTLLSHLKLIHKNIKCKL